MVRILIHFFRKRSKFIGRLFTSFQFRLYLVNWIELILLSFGLKSKIYLSFKSGFFLKDFRKDYWRYLKYYKRAIDYNVSFSNTERKIIAHIKNFDIILADNINGIYQINEVFVKQIYNHFDFRDKTIIDIGGYIGDTAIFFTSKGAKKVNIYEINPQIFDTLNENIKINQLQDKITAHNYGISNKSKISDFYSTEKIGSSGTYLNFSKSMKITEKRNIKLVAFKCILKEPVDIIKIDCEGCEYEILLSILKDNLYNLINDGIILEAHNLDNHRNPEYAKELIKKIGFKVVDLNIKGNNWELILAKP